MPALLSIVIPLFNEAENLAELYGRLNKVLQDQPWEIEYIFVDDGSRDATPQILVAISAEDTRLKYIRFTRNFGHQVAIQAGLRHANGSRVLVMDGDLQDPPELIPSLLHEMDRTGCLSVYAKRRRRNKEGLLKKMTARVFYRVLNMLSDVPIPVDTGDFRLLDRLVVENLNTMKEPSAFLRGQTAWLGYKSAYVEYNRDGRGNGNTGFTWKRMINFAFDGITGFSDAPLKFATLSGLVVSTLSFFLIVYVLVAKFVFQATISGWTSIMVTILFLGGIQLLSLGIIGEYVSRIIKAVRDRPLYVIESSNISNAAS